MIIQDYDISMQGQRFLVEHHEVSERLDIANGQNRVHMERHETNGKVETSSNRSTQANQAFQLEIAMPALQMASLEQSIAEDPEMQLPSKLQIAKELLRKFYGIDIKIVDFSGNEKNKAPASTSPSPAPPQETGDPRQAANTSRQQWAMQYTYNEIHYQKEGVTFSAGGNVTTEDGREINFDIDMEMSRETFEQSSIHIQAGNRELLDPLALNFDGQGVKLTDEKYRFDLDNDGETENISFLEQGSGFLVLDKNQNGQVDNGSELFGPATNDGFLELKAYDSDDNQWIDENDAIFYQLSLWTKDNDGTDHLTSLTHHNVGALYLDSTATTFDLGQGKLRDTGIFLTESGTVNPLQEVDLIV